MIMRSRSSSQRPALPTCDPPRASACCHRVQRLASAETWSGRSAAGRLPSVPKDPGPGPAPNVRTELKMLMLDLPRIRFVRGSVQEANEIAIQLVSGPIVAVHGELNDPPISR